MKIITSLLLALVCANAVADNTPSARPVIFSTTVDWAGVTGLPLRQYIGKVKGIDRDFVKQGLVLYYLDMFPCYGEMSNVRVWLSPNGKSDQNLRIICVYKPETISFAWRNGGSDAIDERTTGMITCPVDGDRDFTVDISKCEHDKDWKDR